MYFSQASYEDYAFVVKFLNTNVWGLSPAIKFSYDTVNPNFTRYLLTLRYTCLAISIVMMIAFIVKLKKISRSHWVIE